MTLNRCNIDESKACLLAGREEGNSDDVGRQRRLDQRAMKERKREARRVNLLNERKRQASGEKKLTPNVAIRGQRSVAPWRRVTALTFPLEGRNKGKEEDGGGISGETKACFVKSGTAHLSGGLCRGNLAGEAVSED